MCFRKNFRKWKRTDFRRRSSNNRRRKTYHRSERAVPSFTFRSQLALPSPVMTDNERALIVQALDEDAGRGDPTTAATIDRALSGSAYFLAKADGILAGID